MNQQRISRDYVQRLVAPAAEVFPLICPVRETEWLDGFTFETIYSASGLAEEGFVFITENPGEPDTVWTITKHDDKRKEIEFLRVTPGILLTAIRVKLADADPGQSTAHITYTFTSLGPKGDQALEGRHNQENFTKMAKNWEASINHYLSKGQVLKLPR